MGLLAGASSAPLPAAYAQVLMQKQLNLPPDSKALCY